VIDGGENDGVARDVHNDASAGQVGDDLLFAVLRLRRNDRRKEEQKNPEIHEPQRNVPHAWPRWKGPEHPQ